jgi:6-phosphogluconate dehydrogenase
MEQADIGVFGLGTMGSALALNIAEKGFRVAVINREQDWTDRFMANAGELADRFVPTRTVEEFVGAIRSPRPLLIMIPAGAPVNQQVAALKDILNSGDIIIDGGNSDFHDTIRHNKELDGTGITFVGMGVSGGEEGARHGPSMMVGSTREAFERIEPILMAIAARAPDGEPCAAWLGTDGAGHFTKTIHNGIEYADMQMIAEIYGLLRDGMGLAPAESAEVFERWNAGPLNSFLIEITSTVLKVDDPETGKPIVDVILDRAGQKGTGKWSAIEAQNLGVPASAIEAAVGARVLSSLKAEREKAADVYGDAVPKTNFFTKDKIDDLEKALLAGKIVAYAQGFATMAAASRAFGWGLPLPTIAKIWRAGCIIRSQFLGDIAKAYDTGEVVDNLVMAPDFVDVMKDAQGALRRVVAGAAEAGLPVPALSAALAYFDSYRQRRGTTDLIQGQRDFFGAHGFERIDEAGTHHGPWGSNAPKPEAKPADPALHAEVEKAT